MNFNFTEQEYEMITDCREYYAQSERNCSHRQFCSTQEFLSLYFQNKSTLFKMFGEQFILEKDIIIDKAEASMRSEVNHSNFCNDGVMNKFYQYYRSKIYDLSTTYLAQYRTPSFWGYSNPVYDALYFQMITEYSLITNEVQSAGECTFESPKGQKVVITKGMKLMKALAKIVDAFDMDKDLFEQYRIAHSQLLNDKLLKGKLCISIHPLDYITMSDNDCGWSSCMSWREEGCYRRGTIEMMNSPYVIVAYLKSDKDMPLIDNPYGEHWNSKKWRQLFVVSDTIITGIKAYPYPHDDLTKMVIEWLRDLGNSNLHRHYTQKIYGVRNCTEQHFTVEDVEPLSNIVEGTKIRCCFHTDSMYNDFGAVKNGIHYFCYDLNNHQEKFIDYHLCYSGEATCIWCGVEGISGIESHLLCEDCGEPSYSCDWCGWHGREDDFYYINGERVCCSCYDDNCFYDHITQQDCMYDDSIPLTLCYTNHYIESYSDMTSEEQELAQKQYRELTGEQLPRYEDCCRCKDILNKCWINYPMSWSNFFKCDKPHYDTKTGEYWVMPQDCKPEALTTIFGLWNKEFVFFEESPFSSSENN